MTKKCISLLLALIMVFCFSGMALAADMSISVFDRPADIALDQDRIFLIKDDTTKLTPTLASDLSADDIVWESENPAIAKVDKNGNVTGVDYGKTNITATAGKKTVSCEVEVVALVFDGNGGLYPSNTYVDNITLNGADVVSVDRTYRMYPVVYLDGATTEIGDTLNVFYDIRSKVTNQQVHMWIDGKRVLYRVGNKIYQPQLYYEHTSVVNSDHYVEEVFVKDTGETRCTWRITYQIVQLTLDAETLNMAAGEQKKLNAEVKGLRHPVVLWESSDESVAKVDEQGNVTAVGTGKVVITATEPESGYTDTCEVIVGEPVADTVLSLDQTALTLDRDASATLTPSFSGNAPVDAEYVWTSSDDTIATVENGVVKGLRSGEAVITVTCGEYSAACVVTVTGDPIKEGLTLSESALTLGKDKSAELTATLSDDIALNPTFKWVSTDRDVARVENGKVTGIGYGTATIVAKYHDYQAECTVTVAPIVYADDALRLILAEPEGENTVLFIDESNAQNPIVYLNYDITAVSDIPALTATGEASIGNVTVENGMGTQTVTANDKVWNITYKTSSLVLDKTELTLDEGKGAVLTAYNNGTDDATVTWESDNEKVATVRNGVVTAVGLGVANIKVSAGDYEAVCKVTVANRPNKADISEAVFTVKTHAGNVGGKPGDIISIPVYVDEHDLPDLTNNSFFHAFWDKNALTFKSATAGQGINEFQLNVSALYPYFTGSDWKECARIDFGGGSSYALPLGEVFYLNFEVNENAVAGVYTVDCMFKQGCTPEIDTGYSQPFAVSPGYISESDKNLNTIYTSGNVLISGGENAALAFANFEFETVSARSDENAVVPVSVTHDLEEKVKSLQIVPVYDSAAMTLSAVALGEDLSGAEVSLENGVVTVRSDEGFVLPQGEILKLTFDMADTIADGSYSVSFDTTDQVNNQITDVHDKTSYGVNASAGFVNVKNYYGITVQSEGNGVLSADKVDAAVGETVTLTSAPGEGQRLAGVTVEDSQGNAVSVNNLTFIMPSSSVTVRAEFVEQKNMDVTFRMIGGTRPNYDISWGGVFNGVAVPNDGYGKYNGAEYQNWVMPETHTIAEGTTAWQFVESMLIEKDFNYTYGEYNFSSLSIESPKILSDVRGSWVMENHYSVLQPELSVGFWAFWCITIVRDGEYIEKVDFGYDHEDTNLKFYPMELEPGDEVILHFAYDVNFELATAAGVKSGYDDDKYIQNYLKATLTPEEIAGIWKTEDLIDAIGTVNRNSKDAIEAAEAAYKSLQNYQKVEVENYAILKDARKRYDELIENNLLTAPILDADSVVEISDKEIMTSTVTLAAPEDSVEDSSATVQYSMSLSEKSNWGPWQDSKVFEGLTPGKTYYFRAQYVGGSSSYNDSGAGNVIKVVAPHVVSTREEWLSALSAAPTDGTRCIIQITDTVDVSMTGVHTTRIPLGSNVVVVGDGGMLKSSAGGQNNNGIAVGLNSTLTLKDITYESIGPVGATQYSDENANFGSMIYYEGENATVNLDNVVMYGDCSETGDIFTCKSTGCTLNIYSGSIDNIAIGYGYANPRRAYNTAGMTEVTAGSDLTINLCPTGDISMEGTFESGGKLTTNLIPQEGYPIRSASTLYNGYTKFEDLSADLDAINAATKEQPYTIANGIGGLRVIVSENGLAVPKKLESPDVTLDDIIIEYGKVTAPSPTTHPEKLISKEQPKAVLQYRITAYDGGYWQTQSTLMKWRCEPMTFVSQLSEDTLYRLEMRYNALGGDYANSDLTIVYFRTGYHTTQLAVPHLSNEALKTDSTITLTAPVGSTQDTTATMEYRVSTDQQTWSDWQDSPVFENLSGGTTYYFQARYKATHYLWTDSEGSNIVEITTRASALQAPVLSDEVVVSHNSVTLTAPAASSEDPEAVVQYRISDDGENWYTDWQDSPVFEDLEGNTAYYFQARYVASVADRLNSEGSNIVVVKTLVDPASASFVVSESYGHAGGTVNVTVSVANNPGIVTAALDVDYDSEKLELIAVTNGDILPDGSLSSSYSDPYTLRWNAVNSNVTANGVLATLTFKVKDDVVLGDTPITLTYDADNVYNADLDNVKFNVIDGVVTIGEVILGDVDGNGKVEGKDVTALYRYLAGWSGYSADTLDLVSADVNGDDDVDAKDATYLTRALADWDGYEL